MPEARKAVAPPGTKCAQGERADMPQGWLTVGRSPAFGYPAKDHVLAWRPEMRIWCPS